MPSLNAIVLALIVVPIFLFVFATPAFAADHLSGATIPLYDGLPFAGLLLSIALGPIVAKRLWHVHYGTAAACWAIMALVLLFMTEGVEPVLTAFAQTMIVDYLPFILMLFALYTAAGGIVVSELDGATPLTNTALLAIGTLTAALIGPIGASMILIRPVLQANARRRHQQHVIIFFIFLVSNIGGVVTPLGNPPLFFGFLRGVPFFWPLQTLWPQMLLAVVLLLSIFFWLDWFFYEKELTEPRRKPFAATGDAGVPSAPIDGAAEKEHLRLVIRGLPNVGLIALVVAVILTTAVWRPNLHIDLLGIPLAAQNLIRDAGLLAIGLAALVVTPQADHKANHFNWDALIEVALLFAAIFVCIIPVMAMLEATTHGPFAPVIAALSTKAGGPNNPAYFWASGLLSAFLDNGPTYLVFVTLAGGDPAVLIGRLAKTLEAISLGAVFMGALTYIGNAPNFMVYAMARRARVDMPGFFGYMAWSCAILLPVFVLVTVLFLR